MTLKSVEYIHTLYNNPFLLAPVLPSFFSALNPSPNNVLLSYIVLPLVLPEHTRKSLTKLKQGRSSLLTFTSPTHKEHRQRFLGLGVRVGEFRDLTNACLQYCFDLGSLNIGADLSIEAKDNSKLCQPSNCPDDIVAAASKLGAILKSQSIPTVFAELGLANL